MLKNKKIILIILAGLIAVLAVTGIIFYVVSSFGKHDTAMLTAPTNSDNRVEFRDNVHIADNSAEIQKNFDSLSAENEEYTITYKNSLPDFFKGMQIGEIFCVYPDSGVANSFFSLGFSGILTDIGENTVSFTVPKLSDVFSDIYINSNTSDGNDVISASFQPSENITDVRYMRKKEPPYALASVPYVPLAIGILPSIEMDESIRYRFKEAKTSSLLDDYVLLCEELEIKLDCELTDDSGFSIGAKGNVTFEETAVKMLLDYHYDKATDAVEINDYSLGFITKQKVDLNFSAKQRIGLDELDIDMSDDLQIINIEDVTESEKGKIVLGTYLIGWEAALPVLQNDTNKVSYLSLGIAVQLSLTGNGELSLEYDIEESGFAKIEVNGNGDNTYLVKGYDYPNPVTDSRQPTAQEQASVPSVTSKIKGEANFNLALGTDIGICILGMIPIKQANNLVEFEIIKTFAQESDKAVEVVNNNYLLDDNVDSLAVSSNSYLKMHFGAKINLGLLKYSVSEMGGSIQLFKDIWFQSPPAVGFSHSQCGFGGVFVGEIYSNDELDKAFKNYMKDTDHDSIIASVKDSMFGSLVNKAINDFDIDLSAVSDSLYNGSENYKFNYYTSGVIYVRDETDRVVTALVVGEDIFNAAGFHTGLSLAKSEQVYSSPDESAGVNINIGTLIRSILDIEDIEDTDLVGSVYYSCDSNEQMDLVFCDGILKMIIVASR